MFLCNIIFNVRYAGLLTKRFLSLPKLNIMRQSSTANLNIDEARRHWRDDAIQQMSRSLNRDIQAFDVIPKPDLSDMHVHTYRVIGTDQYVPMSQVYTRKHPIVTVETQAQTSKKVRRFPLYSSQHIDSVSDRHVDVFYASMKPELRNVITVGQVQQTLPLRDIDLYGLDLLRIHLFIDFVSCGRGHFYFCIDQFC